MRGNAGIYCVCEIPGKPHTRFQTGVADDVRNPAWEGEDHVHTIEDYVAGEPLTITLLQDGGAGNHEPSTVGVATLQSSSFYPGGFQGEAPLLEGSGSAAVGARLQLCVRAPAAEEQAATSPSGHNVADVTVQVDTFTGLRRREDQPPGRPHTYLLRAVWVGQDGGLRTPERLGAQSKAGGDGEEDCTFKQQIKLRAAPGVDELVVGLFRLIDGTAEDELIGACKLDTRNPDHCKVHTHPVMDRDNTPTGAIAKMKLKVTMRDGGDAKRAVTPMLQMPDDTDQEWPPASSPGSLPSTARGRFTPPGRAPPRSPRSRIDPFDGAPDRVHELYAEHEHRRARREQLVAAKEEEELLALESEREALKRNRQLHRGATDNLSPTKASERLYNDAHRRRVRIEAKVREQDGLLKAKPSPRASVDPHAVSNRLYEEHQRRIQVQEKRRHEKEAREAREIDELQRRAPPAGRAGEARHEQMYAEAEAKRERLDKMRRAAEEREAQMRSPVTNGARRTAANPQRFEQLYEDHENRQMRMMKLQKDFQANQEARLASEAYRAPRSPNWASPSRHAVCVVLAAVRGVDCGRLLDPASPAPLEAVKEAVQEALATEAELPWDGAAIAANMTTEISEGDGGALALRTTIELPAGLAQAAQDALDSSADLCEVLAKAVEDECTEEIFVDELVVSNISVSLVAGTPASARRTASPGSRLLAGTQSSNSRTQSHPSTKPPPPELKTAVDYAVAAVVSAVQLRSGAGGDAQPSSAELRALAASLRPALGAYSNAQSACEKVEGYSALCQRGSHRLFQGGLLPDAQAWQQGRDLDPIRQVRDDLDELLATAGRAQAMLQELVAPEADAGAWAPGRTVPFPSGVPRAAFAYSSGPKSREDAFAKARIRYAPAEGELSFRHVLDFAQVAIVFPTCETLLFGLEDIVRRLDVVGVRNRFAAPAGRLGRRHVDVLVAGRSQATATPRRPFRTCARSGSRTRRSTVPASRPPPRWTPS
ncbi:unnamed protein product [Prorocentrum cordatum]|uniref:C2 domain-containing protein n=1 Tax=Prorocentrum cordatum TaxID=2364126 RepID=A0ABN9YEN0_9DINO|nr:unnamed protein product [Polarella glacialis]